MLELEFHSLALGDKEGERAGVRDGKMERRGWKWKCLNKYPDFLEID